MNTIKLGSKGEDVKTLQRLLGLKVDGEFGTVTEKAVKEFQKKRFMTFVMTKLQKINSKK